MIDRFEQFVSYISAIHRDIQKIERDEMVKYGLKGAYAQYLVAMHRYPEGITAAELCEVCGKDKAAVSRALSEMESKGLIVKQCNHDNQYRAQLLLTQAGMDAANYVCRKAVTAVKIAGQDLNDETRTILYRSLRGIAAQLQKITEDGISE
ncbi:MAG: MarR family transcriptional regulator [Oscillospiraceae bacterium]|nr:MarR family transcriptional regulator [Oscillospiraceae bacterium]